MRQAKQLTPTSILNEFDLLAVEDGHIGLVMETPENIAFLNEFDQLLYKDFRNEIKMACKAHNALYSSTKDAYNVDKNLKATCSAIEKAVIKLCDEMNDFLDLAFLDLEKEIKKNALNCKYDFIALDAFHSTKKENNNERKKAA